ncbi:hypothetical protein [Altibacter sp. HG106]|uniref:hypothetical protein n=1 Tax=Altibacter sp. HG106 TaxID=3023937 RepID=UPI002350BD63|nr:hypothetical protein [Altibacter sp. HG106]MDC7996297.1 hypothetical protein [Altibacter sp. HG106]
MKYLLISFLALCCLVNGKAQNKSVQLDYEVTYAIPSPKRNTVDTIGVHFAKSGKFLFTDSNTIGTEFSKEIFENRAIDFSSATTSILLDTEVLQLFFNYTLGRSTVYFVMNMEDIIPVTNEPLGKKLSIISEKITDAPNASDKKYETYALYTAEEPENIITLTVDPTRPVNNNAIIGEFFRLMLSKTNSTADDISFDIPQGLIVSVAVSGTTLLNAIQIADVTTKINISHTFNIEQ